MIGKFTVVQEVHNKWPAKGDRPGGETFNILLMDRTSPLKYALRTMHEYRLTEEEKEKYWGNLADKTVEIGVTELANGNRKAVLRGEIMSISREPKK